MMNRKEFLSLLAALSAAAVLSGCGGKNTASASAAPAEPALQGNLDAMLARVLEANPISNPFELGEMNIEYDFLLPPEDVAGYRGVKSNNNGDAGMVLVLQAAPGKAGELKSALEAYKKDQIAFYGNYAEFAAAQASIQNSLISANGDYLIMAAASAECPDAAALETAVADALQG